MEGTDRAATDGALGDTGESGLMGALRSSGYFLWFAASMLAVSLFWPFTSALLMLILFDDPGDTTGIVDSVTGMLAGTFITLPITVVILLLAAIVTLFPAAFGWRLGGRVASQARFYGRKAAFFAGAGATVFWLLTLVAAMTISDRTGPLLGAVALGGPTLVIVGPALAVLLFHKRFPRPQDGGN